ncbi:MAG: DUF4293 domain-containing protein [Prevotella sp.]
MIQRIQSAYLAISILLLIVSSCFPWGYISNQGNGDLMEVYNLYVNIGKSYSLITLPLFLIQLAAVLLSAYTISSYGNRRNQMRLCTFILVLLVGWHLLATVFFLVLPDAANLEVFRLHWFSVLPLVSVLLTYLARRAIHADEELVRSADRIR